MNPTVLAINKTGLTTLTSHPLINQYGQKKNKKERKKEGVNLATKTFAPGPAMRHVAKINAHIHMHKTVRFVSTARSQSSV